MPYAEAPWIFKGKALYQLQLVKESEARKYTPAELPLVSLFGYTLGGFYLARYSDSPVGAFDELVVISGLVWNAPTSCAWAARVYVNDSSARNHGRQDVGLPSRLASFSEGGTTKQRRQPSWWHTQAVNGLASQGQSTGSKTPDHTQAATAGAGTSSSNGGSSSSSSSSSSGGVTVRNIERRHWAQPWRKNSGQLQSPVCTLELPDAGKGWKGPRLNLSLPSFSGNTVDQPGLLQYSCRLKTNIRPSSAAKVSSSHGAKDDDLEVMAGVLGGRPVLALCFEDMEMKVNAPVAYKLRVPDQQLAPTTAV